MTTPKRIGAKKFKPSNTANNEESEELNTANPIKAVKRRPTPLFPKKKYNPSYLKNLQQIKTNSENTGASRNDNIAHDRTNHYYRIRSPFANKHYVYEMRHQTKNPLVSKPFSGAEDLNAEPDPIEEKTYGVRNDNYTAEEVTRICNMYKRDSMRLFMSGLRQTKTTNNQFKVTLDGWYTMNAQILKLFYLNQEKMISILSNNSHKTIFDICKAQGGALWADENLVSGGEDKGRLCKEIKSCCDKLNSKIDASGGMLTQWGCVKTKGAINVIGERFYIETPKTTLTMVNVMHMIFKTRNDYNAYKYEKSIILYKYYYRHQYK